MRRSVVLAIGGGVVLVALAVAAVLTRWPMARPRSPLQLDVRIVSPLDPPQRHFNAHVGDRVVIRGSGADQLWVYRDRVTIARCPGEAAGCSRHADSIELSFDIDAPARYQVLAVSGAADLTPSGDFDRDVLSVRARGARLELQSILAMSQSPSPRSR